jgi:hypothetical protein
VPPKQQQQQQRIDKKKPHRSTCPRERFHRPGSYCKACDTLIK